MRKIGFTDSGCFSSQGQQRATNHLNFALSPNEVENMNMQAEFNTPASMHVSVASLGGPSECASFQKKKDNRRPSGTSVASSNQSSFFKPAGMILKGRQNYKKSRLGITAPGNDYECYS
eukprot:CAMPEP_0170510244 /NCGR_PEP_ID=MMETSP0208-20121228/65663_1 /TAXON_ID=197538 /ORGANISM="Strombidium inclinatum, Strain S3" /LENGTH=118 /DNA_ID=CAMNT_0010793695 /DNA_START=1773 /DNA_END=2129 /DNA_ORIENTATION=+